MRRLAVLGLALVALAACATPITPKTTVSAMMLSLKTAEDGAQAYAKLPLCENTALTVCARRDVLASIRTADNEASDAINRAFALVSDRTTPADRMTASVELARQALTRLQDIVPWRVSQ